MRVVGGEAEAVVLLEVLIGSHADREGGRKTRQVTDSPGSGQNKSNHSTAADVGTGATKPFGGAV